jgi:hypothetical protein
MLTVTFTAEVDGKLACLSRKMTAVELENSPNPVELIRLLSSEMYAEVMAAHKEMVSSFQ